MKKTFQKLLSPKRKKLHQNKKKIASITNIDLFGKTILLRCDFNVPIKNGKVLDNFKIKQSLPTIKELLQNRCKVVIISHLGRPKGKLNRKYSLDIVAKELSKLLPRKTIKFLRHTIGKDVKGQIKKTKQGQIILLENLRFYQEEEDNDLAFAHSLAELANFYVFDAFAVSHRNHCSTTLLPKFIPSVQGLLMQDEVHTINSAKQNRKESLWVFGGAKLDKISVIKYALKHAKWVYVGGALCFSFLRAKGLAIGHSKISKESVKIAKQILSDENSHKIILPTDIVCAKSYSDQSDIITFDIKHIPNSSIGLDIGSKSCQELLSYVTKSNQVIWNGPLGYIENEVFQKSSIMFLEALFKCHARTIIGGGETGEFVRSKKKENQITHMSTGGGAILSLLSGKKLPACEALHKSAIKYKLIR